MVKFEEKSIPKTYEGVKVRTLTDGLFETSIHVEIAHEPQAILIFLKALADFMNVHANMSLRNVTFNGWDDHGFWWKVTHR